MSTLREQLLTEENRPRLVQDCARMIADEVASKKGLKGMAIKTAFKTVTAVKPGIIEEVCKGLVDKFVDQLESIYGEYLTDGGNDIKSYVTQRAADVADALLFITDAQARKSRNPVLVKAYGALRPQGKKLVVQAVPRVGAMLEQHGI